MMAVILPQERHFMGDRTKLEIVDGVAWLTLDDGKVNALSTEMLGEIAAALDAAEAAGAVVVLRGRDGMFSAGFDLNACQGTHGVDAARAEEHQARSGSLAELQEIERADEIMLDQLAAAGAPIDPGQHAGQRRSV